MASRVMQAAAHRQVAHEENPFLHLLTLLPVATQATGQLPVKPRNLRLCPHWQQNKCNFGDACSFSHECEGGPSAKGVYPGVVQRQQQDNPATIPGVPELAQANSALAALGIDLASLLQVAAAAPRAVALQQQRAVPHRVQPRRPESQPARPEIASADDQDFLAALGLGEVELEQEEAVEAIDATSANSQRACSHWAQFKCNFGDQCKFSHDGPGGPSERGIYPGLLHQPARPTTAPSRTVSNPYAEEDEERMDNKDGGFDEAPASDYFHEEAEEGGALEAKPSRLCSHWEQFKCNFGDQCKFSHDGPGGPSERGVYPGLPGAQRQSRPPVQAMPALPMEVPKKTRLCLHWQQFRCNYGDACGFSHDCPGGASQAADCQTWEPERMLRPSARWAPY